MAAKASRESQLMARYRRVRLSRGDSIASAAVSLVVGTGAAVVTFYLTRLLLSRETLAPVALPESDSASAAALPAPGRVDGSED